MILNEFGETVSAHDNAGGLYVRNRGGHVVKIEIPENCMAFQTGEALQIASDN